MTGRVIVVFHDRERERERERERKREREREITCTDILVICSSLSV